MEIMDTHEIYTVRLNNGARVTINVYINTRDVQRKFYKGVTHEEEN